MVDKIDPNPNWQPGDIALCVRGGPIEPTNPKYNGDFPLCGRPYTVEAVSVHGFYTGTSKTQEQSALTLKDGPTNFNGRKIWAAHRFIKVTPPQEMVKDT